MKPIGTIWRDLEFQKRFRREKVFNRGSRNRIRRKNEQALGILREAKFLGTAHHAFAFDSAKLAALDFKISRHHGPRKSERHLVADFVIFCPADDLARDGRTIVDLADTETIRIRVLDGLQDLSDHDLIDRGTSSLDASNFKPSAAKEGFDIGCRQLAIHKITQPVERNFHE